MHAHKPVLLGLWMSMNVVVSLSAIFCAHVCMPGACLGLFICTFVCVFSPTGAFVGMCALEPAYECLPRVGVCVLCECVCMREGYANLFRATLSRWVFNCPSSL